MTQDENQEKKEEGFLLPNSVVELLITDSFQRNGISMESTEPVSDENKEQVRRMIDDLSRQVTQYMDQQKKNEEERKNLVNQADYEAFMREQQRKKEQSRRMNPPAAQREEARPVSRSSERVREDRLKEERVKKKKVEKRTRSTEEKKKRKKKD